MPKLRMEKILLNEKIRRYGTRKYTPV